MFVLRVDSALQVGHFGEVNSIEASLSLLGMLPFSYLFCNLF